MRFINIDFLRLQLWLYHAILQRKSVWNVSSILKASCLNFSKRNLKMLQSAGHNTGNTIKTNECAASASATCHGSIALPSKEMEAWRGQSNNSLNYVVSQLKSLCKLLRAMQNNCNCCVQWRKNLPHPWKFVAVNPL